MFRSLFANTSHINVILVACPEKLDCRKRHFDVWLDFCMKLDPECFLPRVKWGLKGRAKDRGFKTDLGYLSKLQVICLLLSS